MSLHRRPRQRVRAGAVAWFALALCVAAAAVAAPETSRLLAAQQQATPASRGADRQSQVVCGGCHAVPPPEILPRDAWRDEFVRMMFLRENRLPPIGPPGLAYRNIPLPPDMEALLPSYIARAPERLPAPEAWPEPSASSRVKLTRRSLALPELPGTAAVSSVRIVDFDRDGRTDVLGTDMRHGVVFIARAAATAEALASLATLPHPAYAAPADVDRDGLPDLLVGDMGEFFPADHTKGAVVWMRGLPGGKFGAFWLDGWPRVAHVEAADFNGDGRNDLVVAAFGWRRTGQVSVLEHAPGSPNPSFTPHVIDKRPGAIRTIPADLNRDGHMDIVALLAQEHETVVAYLNTGRRDFSFEPRVIYAAPHPNWGSSGIQLGDADSDGDQDVVLVHGDTFDDGIVKPYHGIQLLENTGGFPFAAHALAQMPGVHGSALADVDGDGDEDIVASALLAGGSDVDEKTLPALVWLEQVGRGRYVRHTIEMGFPRHAALDAGDIDGDGDVDIVVGNFSIGKSSSGWIDLWVNHTK